ncbi:CapA family protein [Phytohabitans kaempferiae]|uniref:CapA family protein n=1 Tax=Phytohabitans kaempferiae TaxID=1620943 RepID=A0ABV6LXP5_9ACTN
MMLFLCGDVMTGRGVDQILPHPGDRALWEGYVRDAHEYVALAESAHGPIPRPVPPSWPWGDTLPRLEQFRPDARIINLETSVTDRGVPAPGKGIHYRMHPANIACLTAARPSVVSLANNHVLDFGTQGLADTLDGLSAVGIQTAGAGPDASSAQQPAVVPVDGGRRVVVFAAGTRDSGIPSGWAATGDRAGVRLLPDLSSRTAAEVGAQVQRVKRRGDVVVFTVHWRPNWGYHVDDEQVRFAHDLVERGVDVVHGHSSHHPRPIEIYHGKLILYGCGDFIDDYEGIGGHEQYRSDLHVMYLPSIDPDSGRLARLTMIPLQAQRMRLRATTGPDTTWLGSLLDRISRPFHTRIDRTDQHTLEAVPDGNPPE